MPVPPEKARIDPVIDRTQPLFSEPLVMIKAYEFFLEKIRDVNPLHRTLSCLTSLLLAISKT
jgi:hypothetical protein